MENIPKSPSIFSAIDVATAALESEHGRWNVVGITIIGHMRDGSLQIVTTPQEGSPHDIYGNASYGFGDLFQTGTFGDHGRKFEVKP